MTTSHKRKDRDCNQVKQKKQNIDDVQNIVINLYDCYVESDYNHDSNDFHLRLKDTVTWKKVVSMGYLGNKIDEDSTTYVLQVTRSSLSRDNTPVDLLEVMKSGLPNSGLGLFAACSFPPNMTFSFYVGYKISCGNMNDKEKEELQDRNPYLVSLKKDYLLNPIFKEGDSCYESKFLGAHFINDCHFKNISDGRKHYNAVLEGILVKSIVAIRKGQEIFINYNLTSIV